MMRSDSQDQPSLVTTICANIGKVAIGTLAVLSMLVFAIDCMNYDHLYLDHVGYEAHSLLDVVKNEANGLSSALPESASHYAGTQRADNGFRALDGAGQVTSA